MDALARAAADARKSDQKFTARDLFGPLSDDLDDGAVLEKPKPEKKSAKPAKKKKVRKTKKVKKVTKTRKRKRPDARKELKKKQHQRNRRIASMAMGVTVADVAMFDNDSEKVFDEDKAMKTKRSKNLEGIRFTKRTKPKRPKEDNMFYTPMLAESLPSTKSTSRKRENNQHWKSIPFSNIHKIKEDITDADDTGLDPKLIDWGDEPCPEYPAGRTPSWHLALGKFLQDRAEERMGGPCLRSLRKSGNGISQKLKAIVALRKARDALNQQIPPELVAYDASMHLHLREQAGKLIKLSEKTQADKNATAEDKDLVHKLVVSFLDGYYDFRNMRRAMIKAFVGASIQLQSISYNTALVADQNGIPRRMRPKPGHRPLIRWMHAEVYDTEKVDNTVLRPAGVRGQGRRLRVAIKGKQTRGDEGATRKNASDKIKVKTEPEIQVAKES